MKNSLGVLALASVLTVGLLTGCGSSGPATTPVSGNVVKGPVDEATVFADKNGNFNLDSGEVSAKSGSDGKYTLNIPVGYGDYVIVTEGGTDTLGIDGNVASQMVAPMDAKNVTPFTTLVALGGNANVAALKSLVEGLGLTSYDEDFSKSATPATLMLAKSLETIQKSVGDSVSTVTKPQQAIIQAQVMQAVAKSLAGSTVAALSAPTTLNTALGTAVGDAITAVNTANANVVLPVVAAAIANAAVESGAAVAGTTAASAVALSVLADDKAAETNINTNDTVKTAISTALTTAKDTITAGGSVVDDTKTWTPPTTPIEVVTGAEGGTAGH